MTAWYVEKLGLRKMQIDLGDCEAGIALGFNKKTMTLQLVQIGRPTDELAHILYATNVL